MDTGRGMDMEMNIDTIMGHSYEHGLGRLHVHANCSLIVDYLFTYLHKTSLTVQVQVISYYGL